MSSRSPVGNKLVFDFILFIERDELAQPCSSLKVQVTSHSYKSIPRLTRFPVLGLRFALHLMVDRHDGDGVLGVRLQVLQDGGGGGSRHLVLVGGGRETTLNWANSRTWGILRKDIIKKRDVWQRHKDSWAERCHSSGCCEPSFFGCSISR